MVGGNQATWSPIATNVTVGVYPQAESKLDKAAQKIAAEAVKLGATPEWKEIDQMEMGIYAKHGADVEAKAMAIATSPVGQVTQQMIQAAAAKTSAVVHETEHELTANKQKLMATAPDW